MTDLSMPFTEMDSTQFQAHLDQRSVNTHDAARVAAFFAERGLQRLVPMGETSRGRQAIRERYEELFRALPDLYVDVKDVFATADRMCVQCVQTATHEGELFGIPPTGRRVELDMCLVLRFGSDGLADEEIIYFDAAAMLRQLGLLPAA